MNTAERDGQLHERELDGQQQQGIEQPGAQLPQEDSQRVDAGHLQQAQGLFLFFLGNRRREETHPAQRDEDEVGVGDIGKEIESRSRGD